MVDQLLLRSKLDVGRLKIEMELNSFEAIKNAVQAGLGARIIALLTGGAPLRLGGARG
jgi:DNA-binding transcriptional LysR family regulator